MAAVSRRSGAPRRLRRPGPGAVLRWLVVAVAAVLVFFPIYWMFVTAVTPIADLRAANYSLWPSSFHWDNFANAWNRFSFGRWYVNSIIIAVASVVLTVCLNLLAGYTFAKLRFPLRTPLFLLIVSTLVIPVQVLMVPQFRIAVDLNLLSSNWGVIVPRLAEAFGLFMARQYFAALPGELIEAARIDGASEFRIFFRVMLPLAKPLIAVLIIFTFMWRWNEFAWPLIILKDQASYTVPIGILLLQGQFTTNYNDLMSMTLLSITPMLAVFLFFQRYFVEGIARTGIK